MPELAMTAKCRECGKVFAGGGFALMVGSGMSPVTQQSMHLIKKLQDHVRTSHAELFQLIVASGAEYQGIRLLSNFDVQSEELEKQMDIARWNIHQWTLKRRFSDEQLLDWVDSVLPALKTLVEMGDTQTLKRNLLGMLYSMRELLEEPGKYDLSAKDPADLQPVA